MPTLTITDILLSYDAPLIVLAVNRHSHHFIGVNYEDGEDGYLFYFARVNDAALQDLRRAAVDVRYLVTRQRIGQYQVGELWGVPQESVRTRRVSAIATNILPAAGMFLPDETFASVQKTRSVHIDGRWGIDDLRRFSDLVQDCYAFVYALTGRGSGGTKQRMAELFHRYPWRGGFSSVNFFDALYGLIPNKDKASITRIQYASPGTIELHMLPGIAATIRGMVLKINESAASVPYETYAEVRAWLQDRGWLGKSREDLNLSRKDQEELLERLEELTMALGLSAHTDEILGLARRDPLAAVKILLAYFRRLDGLADYVATGKAQDLFAQGSSELAQTF